MQYLIGMKCYGLIALSLYMQLFVPQVYFTDYSALLAPNPLHMA